MAAKLVRKFTIVDAMVLVAATAVGLVVSRAFLSEGLTFPDQWTWDSVGELALALNQLIAPVALAWTLAVCLLRLRGPRPRLRLVFRQPGMVACTAALIVFLLRVLEPILAVCVHYLASPGMFLRDKEWMGIQLSDVFNLNLLNLGDGVAVAWILLWLGKACRPERSWIDRTGTVLGIYWFFACNLFWLTFLLN
jgi:hypothetical protein